MLINFKVMDDPNQFSKMLLGMMKLPAPLSAFAGCIVPCVMKSKVRKEVLLKCNAALYLLCAAFRYDN